MPIRHSNTKFTDLAYSFGYGGANAHCILDHPSRAIPGHVTRGFTLPRSYPVTGNLVSCSAIGNGVFQTHSHHTSARETHIINSDKKQTISIVWADPAQLEQNEKAGSRALIILPLSAHDDVALRASIASTSKLLNEFDIADMLYTLGCRKSKFSRCAFVVGERNVLRRNGLNMDSASFGKTNGSPILRIGFVFAGQFFWACPTNHNRPSSKLFESQPLQAKSIMQHFPKFCVLQYRWES